MFCCNSAWIYGIPRVPLDVIFTHLKPHQLF